MFHCLCWPLFCLDDATQTNTAFQTTLFQWVALQDMTDRTTIRQGRTPEGFVQINDAVNG